ncbi:proteoglycan Cow [Vespula maculifrons]|uniref:Proteoglycan Cow n=1 Tax=Vespula maculifrons TaxID=7453 RepID=A0ABD2CL71_VESMC
MQLPNDVTFIFNMYNIRCINKIMLFVYLIFSLNAVIKTNRHQICKQHMKVKVKLYLFIFLFTLPDNNLTISELCRPLNCKKKELCLLEDTFTAVCVSKKELHKSGLNELSYRDHIDVVIPKSLAVQQRRMRTDSSADTQDDDAFFDSEDDDEDQDESKNRSQFEFFIGEKKLNLLQKLNIQKIVVNRGNGSFCDSMLASFPTIRHVRPEVVFSTTFLVTSREVVPPSGKSLGNTEGSLTRRGLSSTTLMTLYALPQDFLAFAPRFRIVDRLPYIGEFAKNFLFLGKRVFAKRTSLHDNFEVSTWGKRKGTENETFFSKLALHSFRTFNQVVSSVAKSSTKPQAMGTFKVIFKRYYCYLLLLPFTVAVAVASCYCIPMGSSAIIVAKKYMYLLSGIALFIINLNENISEN